QLGTMAEKTRRLVALARHVSGLLLLDGRTTEALLRAATLCKADLVTKMVGEFPELQGVIGQIYAELDGEPPEVARAIGEHYLPAAADRAQALSAFAGRPEFAHLYVAYDRASRILSAEAASQVDPEKFEVPAEHRLHEAAIRVSSRVRTAIAGGDYLNALGELLALTEPVDRIFDAVLIMAPQPAVRANRLALLRLAVEAFRLVADFSK